MCGIFGYSFKKGKLSPSRRAVLATNLARFNDERGGDSWGIVGINDKDIRITRGLGDLVDSAYELCDYNTLFAHTRWATTGDTVVENAHPFEIGRIIGAHNGMIYNHHELCEEYKREFEVDSMHLFAHLDEHKPFDDLRGYGSIEWIYRNSPENINLTKLAGGELSVYGIGTFEDVEGVVWSSSHKHLTHALKCAGVKKHFSYQVKNNKVYYVNNGKLFINNKMRLELAKPPKKLQYSPRMSDAEFNIWRTVRGC